MVVVKPRFGDESLMTPVRLPKTENPSGLRQTGFVCPAWYPQAGADLALAVFVTRPQAEAQIGAKMIIRAPALRSKFPEVSPRRPAARIRDRAPLRPALRRVLSRDSTDGRR